MECPECHQNECVQEGNIPPTVLAKWGNIDFNKIEGTKYYECTECNVYFDKEGKILHKGKLD